MNTNRIDIWSVLGIEPTTDKRKIKKAYAAKVKTCHPEESPEEFKQLYEAYQQALEGGSSDSYGLKVRMLEKPADNAGHGKVHDSNEKTVNNEPVKPEKENEKATEENSADAYRFQELFEQNNLRKQEVLNDLISSWEAYMEERNPKSVKSLVQFL